MLSESGDQLFDETFFSDVVFYIFSDMMLYCVVAAVGLVPWSTFH